MSQYKSVISFELSDDDKKTLRKDINEFSCFWDNIKQYTKEVLNGELVSISGIKSDSISFNVIIDGVESNITLDKSDIRDYKINHIINNNGKD
jgi:hypothetical protein